MNKLGLMHGNVETAKGRALDAKHARDVAANKPERKPAVVISSRRKG